MRLMIFIVGLLGLLLLLQWRFPYALAGHDAQMHLLYLVALLAVVASGALRARAYPLSQTVKSAAIWLAVMLMLVLGYSFRDRIMGELVPSYAQPGEGGVMTVQAGQDGHFHIEGEVGGVPVRFMVDTGASDIVLAPGDARRIGIPVETLNYTRMYQTANGMVRGARVRLDTLEIGGIRLRDVPASVNGAPMDESLLGMAFLKELSGYRVEGHTLTLVP